MPIFLEVQSGPSKGQRSRLNPGQTLRVGRTPKSDLVFAEDSLMSGIHFALECAKDACRLQDLNSRNGTSLNGQRVKQSALRHGDMIVAGGTTFLLQIEADQAPSTDALSAVPVDARPHDRLLAVLLRDFQPLYGILDAARDIKILALLLKSNEQYQSLYEGEEGAKLAQVAPYLVSLKKEPALLERLIHEGWGQSWGIYLTSPRDFQDLRKHFRHFLEVQLPDGKQVYFRFYDPRVLSVFLPTCTPEDSKQFFGPVQSFLLEGENPNELLRLANTGNGIEKTMVVVDPNLKTDEATSSETRPLRRRD